MRPRARLVLRPWLRAVSWLVPAARRDRWQEEWTGELELGLDGVLPGVRGLFDLVAGSLRDALDVRRECRRSEGPRGFRFAALGRDLRHAARRLVQAPLPMLGIVATLTLGIGANTSIFAVADAVLWKPLPWPQTESLFVVWERGPQPGAERTRVSLPDYLDWSERASAFETLAAYGERGFNVALDDRAVRLDGHVVSANLFGMLGVTPLLGRDFLPLEEQEGSEPSVILSHELWSRELGGAAGIVGRGLSIDGRVHTVVGVMPRDFRFPGDPALWLPLGAYGGNLRVWRATHVLTVIGRLDPAVEPPSAEASLTGLAEELWEHAAIWTGWEVTLLPLREELYGDVREATAFVWSAGLALLLVLCANLANLSLAEGGKRRAEYAVRAAIGADRRALLVQTSIESGLLGSCAIVAGLGLATGILRAISASLPAAVTAVHPLSLDIRAATYATGLAMLSTVLFGILPTARLIRGDAAGGLRGAAPGSGASGDRRLRSVLVTGQVGLSLVLLVTTMLLADSARRLREVDPGFRPTGAVSFRTTLAGAAYSTPEARRGFYERVERQLRLLPGVLSAGMGSHVPFAPNAGDTGASLFPVDRVPDPGAEQPLGSVIRASPGLLPAIGVVVSGGRGLEPSDDAIAAPVALVNRTAAALLWPMQDPLGARIRTGVTGDAELRVVGVVDDVRFSDLRRPARPQVYVAAAQFPPPSQTFVVATERPDQLDAARLREVVRAVDPTQPIFDVVTLQSYLERSLAGAIVSARVVSALAALAAVLAGVGIYAVVAFSVGMRRSEFSLRQALGARPGDVLWMVLVESTVAVGAGLGLGLVGAAYASTLISSQLFGVAPIHIPTYTFAAAALGLLAIAAALLPAARAARSDPAAALRGL